MAEQRRIMLWCYPRTLSTAFCRVMVSRKSCKVLAEPSVPAYYFGEEWRGAMDGKPIWYPEEWPIPNHTWKDLHKEFMDPYEGYNEVFIKEMPYRFRQFLDTKTLDDVIPRDYVHVFLNRDPVKVTPSFMGLNTGLRKVPREKDRDARHIFEWPEASLVEMQRMCEWVVRDRGYKPLVIDADELQKNPECTLRRFCEFVQIDYQDSMVHWPPPPEDQAHIFDQYKGAFKKAGETDTIQPPTPAPKFEELKEEFQVAINNAMPIYKYLKQAQADRTCILPNA